MSLVDGGAGADHEREMLQPGRGLTRVRLRRGSRIEEEEGPPLAAGGHEGELVVLVHEHFEAHPRKEVPVEGAGDHEVGHVDPDVSEHCAILPRDEHGGAILHTAVSVDSGLGVSAGGGTGPFELHLAHEDQRTGECSKQVGDPERDPLHVPPRRREVVVRVVDARDVREEPRE